MYEPSLIKPIATPYEATQGHRLERADVLQRSGGLVKVFKGKVFVYVGLDRRK
jgi:hypothetical protein